MRRKKKKIWGNSRYLLLDDPQSEDPNANMGLVTLRLLKNHKNRRAPHELFRFCQTVVGILRDNGLWTFGDQIYERKNGTIKVCVTIVPSKVLEEREQNKRR